MISSLKSALYRTEVPVSLSASFVIGIKTDVFHYENVYFYVKIFFNKCKCVTIFIEINVIKYYYDYPYII